MSMGRRRLADSDRIGVSIHWPGAEPGCGQDPAGGESALSGGKGRAGSVGFVFKSLDINGPAGILVDAKEDAAHPFIA